MHNRLPYLPLHIKGNILDLPLHFSAFLLCNIQSKKVIKEAGKVDLKRGTKGVVKSGKILDNPNAKVEDLLVYVNKTLGTSKPVVEVPFKTCPHCEYILDGFNVLSE